VFQADLKSKFVLGCGSDKTCIIDRKLVYTFEQCLDCGIMFRFPYEESSKLNSFYQYDYKQPGLTTDLPSADDVKELAVQVGELFDDPARLAVMGQRARSSAERWPLERAVRFIKELAREIPVSETHFV